MWAIISGRVGNACIGILVNRPVNVEPSDDAYLRVGAGVAFRAEHVIDVEQAPLQYVTEQLAQPPTRLWSRHE